MLILRNTLAQIGNNLQKIVDKSLQCLLCYVFERNLQVLLAYINFNLQVLVSDTLEKNVPH